MIYCVHGKVHNMLIVCHLSCQDREAIVHMKQNAIIPTEHQYTCSHNASETLMLKCQAALNSLKGVLCHLSYPSPNLSYYVNFR